MAIRDYLIVHYHEVGLKGGNRSLFERALVRNIARATSDLAPLKPRRLPGRILVELPAGTDAEEAAQQMRLGAASAQYEDRAVVAGLADLVARRDVTGLPAEGGSFPSEAVTRWQAPH